MPVYKVTLRDGRTLRVEADTPPTENEVMTHLRGNTRTSEQFAPPVDTMGQIASGVGAGVGAGPNTVDFIKNTAKGAMNMVKGLDQRNKPEFGEGPGFDQQVANAVTGRAKEYGKDPLGTIYNDPAAFLMDAGAAVEGGAAAGRGAAAVGRGAMRTGKAALASPVGQGVAAVAKGAIEDTPVLGGAVKGYQTFKAGRDAAIKQGSGRLASKAPSLEDALNDALQEQLGGGADAAKKVTGAPEPTITPSGKEGDFMSSGRPSVSAGRHDEMMPKPGQVERGMEKFNSVPKPGEAVDAMGRPLGGQAADTDYMAKMRETAAPGANPADSVMSQREMERFGGKGPAEQQQTHNIGVQEGIDDIDTTPPWQSGVEDSGAGGYQVGVDPLDGGDFTPEDVQSVLGARGHKWTEAVDPENEPGLHLAELEPGAEADLRRTGSMDDQFNHGGRDWQISSEVPSEMQVDIPEMYGQRQPWHSGETPGSPEAKQASGIHKEEAIMDQFYRQLLDDPNK